MPISRDPDRAATPDPETVAAAARAGMHVVHVICDEPDSDVGVPVSLCFAAVVPTVPRIGETIVLENGARCRVRDVYHKVVRHADDGGRTRCIGLFPNVIADRMPGKGERSEGETGA